MTTVKNIYDYINTISPFDTQKEWDNSGFLIGDFRKEVKNAVIALDCSNEVVEYAESVSADLIITHHPVIFRGVKQIKSDSTIYRLINNDIAQISVHTPFDIAEGGINDNLAKLLSLHNIRKIADGDLVAGELEEGMSIDDFAELVADTLGTNGIRYTDTEKLIKTVAVGGGACGEYVEDAMANADCFVTGEAKYHEMLDAQQMGYAVISAGHFETENKPFLMIKETLEKLFVDVNFHIAPIQNPIKTI
ncbi:MAG: Nif3-like dinuclear metal center hexameric protein [Eubacterium sp.]|nr:Nif3-like dinuclear metal center hexameric protein [Eubacterium sp.]